MKTSLRNQQGASILEFMVVVPILVTFAFTAIEFGAIFTRLNTITKTVQDATRYYATIPNPTREIAERLIMSNSIHEPGEKLADHFRRPITIQDVDLGVAGNHVQITVIYDHTPIAGNALSGLVQMLGGEPLDLNIPLTASSIMRYFNPPV